VETQTRGEAVVVKIQIESFDGFLGHTVAQTIYRIREFRRVPKSQLDRLPICPHSYLGNVFRNAPQLVRGRDLVSDFSGT
jgi:hypothetical protein